MFLSILLLFGFSSAQAQEKTVKGYNEVSLGLGLAGIPSALAGPSISLLYTRGWQFGQYFDAGLSAGYDLGLSAQLRLRARLPFG